MRTHCYTQFSSSEAAVSCCKMPLGSTLGRLECPSLHVTMLFSFLFRSLCHGSLTPELESKHYAAQWNPASFQQPLWRLHPYIQDFQPTVAFPFRHLKFPCPGARGLLDLYIFFCCISAGEESYSFRNCPPIIEFADFFFRPSDQYVQFMIKFAAS